MKELSASVAIVEQTFEDRGEGTVERELCAFAHTSVALLVLKRTRACGLGNGDPFTDGR